MEILPGSRADSFREAAALAFQQAGRGDMLPEMASLFASAIDLDKLGAEAKKSLSSAVRSRYGRGAGWRGRRWYVSVPQPSYEGRPVPHLAFTIQPYLVAAIAVDADGVSYRATAVGPTGRAGKLMLPLPFLQAVLDDGLEQFEVVGQDGDGTSWNIPGLRTALRLPGRFVADLAAALKTQTVAAWLLDFGAEGRAIAPLAAGSLLGLQLHGVLHPLSVGEQPFKREVVIDRLTRMYGSARAAEMLEQAAPFLKSSLTNDEALSLILKETGRRG